MISQFDFGYPMTMHFRFSFPLLTVLFLLCIASLQAAPIHNFPLTLRQPDGSTLHCYASGDEYYNWLHDKDGYTIIQNKATGWYTYAAHCKPEALK
jgi:hypothetical protein